MAVDFGSGEASDFRFGTVLMLVTECSWVVAFDVACVETPGLESIESSGADSVCPGHSCVLVSVGVCSVGGAVFVHAECMFDGCHSPGIL